MERKPEDFADHAAWLAWQQTQLDIKRQERQQAEHKASEKRRARFPIYKKGQVSERIRLAWLQARGKHYRSRALAQDPEGQRAKWRTYWHRNFTANPELYREISRRSYRKNRDKRIWETRRYYAAHQEERCAYTRNWYAEHRDYRLAYNRSYREDHQDEIRLQRQGYCARNAEKFAEYGRIYRKNHREQHNANQRAYRAAHPLTDAQRAAKSAGQRERRARKKAQEGG